MPRTRDTTIGEKFGRLTVTSERLPGSPPQVEVRCDCGTEKTMLINRLGHTLSCGCLQREAATKSAISRSSHGMRGTSEYHIWTSIKQRTTNPKHEQWDSYGGRGITMCERWLNSFEAFLADVGPRPEGLTLDRIDNDRGYEPGNVRWATRAEQARNRRPQLRETCANGHERNEKNVRIRPGGAQTCRACDNERGQRERDAGKRDRLKRGTRGGGVEVGLG